MLHVLLVSIIITSVLWYHNTNFLIVFSGFLYFNEAPFAYGIFDSVKQKR